MIEWLWLLIGVCFGVWVDYTDSSYYKDIVRLQGDYIDLLHKKLDMEND